MGVKRIAMFSGGKDSACLVTLMLKAYDDVTVVFCNTGWELPETITYIDEFNKKYLDEKLVVLKGKKYDGMYDLILKKNYMPSVHHRFCTEELKVRVINDYVKTLGNNVELFNGVRADESYKRRELKRRVYDDVSGCYINRPLIRWTAFDVFEFLKHNNIIINPLYYKGFKRIGCGPCIMVSLKELSIIKELYPQRIDLIRKLEKETKQSFFIKKFIPERFRTGKTNKGDAVGTIDDIIRYLDSKQKYFEIAEQVGESCMSYYNLCE